ncbi:MAG: RDD family protein [Gammaproteobacteria bacterium]|nr:RDD family protein [Gammaproteobacteria bacterium]
MELKFAGLGKRILGGIIDIILLVIVFAIYVRFFGREVLPGSYHVEGMPAFYIFVFIFLYYWVFEAITGKTLGKLIVKTRVVNKEGNKITWRQSFVRNIMRVIDGLFFYLVAAIAIASSEKNQRLGDMLAKTVVINQ